MFYLKNYLRISVEPKCWHKANEVFFHNFIVLVLFVCTTTMFLYLQPALAGSMNPLVIHLYSARGSCYLDDLRMGHQLFPCGWF